MQNENFFLLEIKNSFNPTEIELFKKKVEESFHIGIFPHKGADGDAMGSAFGLAKVLSGLGKTFEILCVDTPKFNLDTFDQFLIGERFQKTPDLLISVDCGSLDRFFIHPDYKNIELINFDHHASNDNFGSINFVDPKRASACEVVFEVLLLAFGKSVFTKESCDAFLTGMITDTQCLANQHLSKQFFYILNLIIELGADFFSVKSLAIPKIKTSVFKLWQQAFGLGMHLCQERLFIIAIDQAYLTAQGLLPEIFDGLCNFLALNLDTDFFAVLVEIEPGKIKGSLRSKKLSAKQVATFFGGGGHERASGFLTDKYLMNDAVEKIKEIVSGQLSSLS